MAKARQQRTVSQSIVMVGALLLCNQFTVAQNAAPPPDATAKPASPTVAVPHMVTVLEDTPIEVRTISHIGTAQSRDGEQLLFSVSEDVRVGDVLAIPRGALAHGVVVHTKKSGVLTGSPEMTLKLTSLELDGRSYPINSYQFKMTGTSKTRPTEKKVITGANVGSIVGSFASGVSTKRGVISPSSKAAGATTGAVVGAGIGTIVAAASPGPAVSIPSEAQIEFALADPVTLPPANPTTAKRLAKAAPAGDPVLYVRGVTP
jgi:hypothetical protein